MKKIFILLLFGGILSTSGFGQKKETAGNLPTFSMGIETALPTGDLGLISSLGLGIKMQTVTPFCSKAGVVFSAAAINYFVNTDAKVADVKNFFAFPVEAGCRLFSAKGLYFEPKAGFTYFSGKGGSDIAFTYALNVGVKANNSVDLSFGYENAPLSGLSLSHAAISVAYILH